MTSRALVALLLLPSLAVAEEPLRPDLHGDPLPPGAVARLGSGRFRPGGFVQYLSFSADGRQLSSFHVGGACPSEFIVWDAATGRELRRTEVHSSGGHWQRLANGRSVSLQMSMGGNNRPVPMEITAPKLPPFVRDRCVRSSSTQKWPPAGNDHRDDDPNGPVQVAGAGDCCALSFDGRLYACARRPAKGADSCPIEVWDLTNRSDQFALAPPTEFVKQPGRCVALRYTPDGRTLVALSGTKWKDNKPAELLAVAWDAKSGRERRRFTAPAPPRIIWQMFTPESSAVQYANLFASDSYLALCPEAEGDAVLLPDLHGKADHTIKTGHRPPAKGTGSAVSVIALSPDGRTLVTGGHDGAVKTWDPAAGRELLHLPDAAGGAVQALAVDPAGKRLACAGRDGVIRLWDLTTRREIAPPPGPRAAVLYVAAAPDGSTAAAVTADNIIHFFDAATGQERHREALPGIDPMSRLALAPDGRTLLFAAGGKLRAWDVASGQPRPAGDAAKVRADGYAARFTPDGHTLLLLRPGTVELHDWPSGRPRRTFPLPPAKGDKGETRASAAALSADGRWLATLSGRLTEEISHGLPYRQLTHCAVDLWDAGSGRHAARLFDDCPGVHDLAFTHAGELLILGYGTLRPRDGTAPVELTSYQLHLIDPATGRLKRSLQCDNCGCRQWNYWPGAGLELSRDGRTLLLGGDNYGTIRVIELATGKMRRELNGHRALVTSLALTPDGRRLVSGGADLTGLVWDLSPAAAAPPGAAAPTAHDVDRLWQALSEEDAAAAFNAMAALATHPTLAVDSSRARVRPVPAAPDDATLDRLIAGLGDARFAARDKAQHELERYGESTAVGLRARLPRVTSPEARKRIAGLLEKYDPDRLTPTRLRELRVVELLEHLNTPQSRALLKELAAGAPAARLTRDATASLRRAEALAQ